MGSLVTYGRMFAVCYEKPKSSIVDQISSARLNDWNKGGLTLTTDSALKLDVSQQQAVAHFLASPENNLYLL